MIVKPNVRALFKGFLHSSAGGRGSQQSLIREGSVRGPTPYTFYSVFDRKCNSFVYLPLKNGTPYENTDEKGARGIKNNKNNRLIDKRVSRCSSVSKWKDLCFRQQRRLLREELSNDICDQVSLLLQQVRIAYFGERKVRFSSSLFLVW